MTLFDYCDRTPHHHFCNYGIPLVIYILHGLFLYLCWPTSLSLCCQCFYNIGFHPYDDSSVYYSYNVSFIAHILAFTALEVFGNLLIVMRNYLWHLFFNFKFHLLSVFPFVHNYFFYWDLVLPDIHNSLLHYTPFRLIFRSPVLHFLIYTGVYFIKFLHWHLCTEPLANIVTKRLNSSDYNLFTL